jgi:hypothetical protein
MEKIKIDSGITVGRFLGPFDEVTLKHEPMFFKR